MKFPVIFMQRIVTMTASVLTNIPKELPEDMQQRLYIIAFSSYVQGISEYGHLTPEQHNYIANGMLSKGPQFVVDLMQEFLNELKLNCKLFNNNTVN